MSKKFIATVGAAFAPIFLIACAKGTPYVPPEVLGWDPPPNTFDAPDDPYDNPDEEGQPQDDEGQPNRPDAGKRDSSTSTPDVGTDPGPGGGKCYSPCSGSVTCTVVGSDTTFDATLSGASICTLASEVLTATWTCDGTAAISTSSASGTGTWEKAKGALVICTSDTDCISCE